VMDLGVMFIVVSALLGGVARRSTDKLIIAAITAMLVGDFVYDVLVLRGSYTVGNPVDAAFLVNYVLIGTLLVLGVLVLVLRQYRRAWPLAIVAGMGFGGTSLAVRAAHVEIGQGFSFVALLAQPAIYLIAGYWVVGMIGYSAALSRGEVGIVTAVFVVPEVVLPGLLGILLLGDPVREGWTWVFVGGLVVSVVGVVVLPRRPPPRRRRVR